MNEVVRALLVVGAFGLIFLAVLKGDVWLRRNRQERQRRQAWKRLTGY